MDWKTNAYIINDFQMNYDERDGQGTLVILLLLRLCYKTKEALEDTIYWPHSRCWWTQI
jgi:hypothetical protein